MTERDRDPEKPVHPTLGAPAAGPPAEPIEVERTLLGAAGARSTAEAEHAQPLSQLIAPCPAPARVSGPDDDLPVVARLIVEIRSDGSRTIARGAVEDVVQGQRVAIEARGDSPLALALALARSITSLPRLSARAAVRGLLERRKK